MYLESLWLTFKGSEKARNFYPNIRLGKKSQIVSNYFATLYDESDNFENIIGSW